MNRQREKLEEKVVGSHGSEEECMTKRKIGRKERMHERA